MNRRDFAILSAQANRQTPRLRGELAHRLYAQVKDASAQIRRQGTFNPTEFVEDWAREMYDAKKSKALNYAVSGYEIAGALIGNKTYMAAMRAKVEEPAGVDVNFGFDAFVHDRVAASVEAWVSETSVTESQTSARIYAEQVENALRFAPADEELTPRKLAQSFEKSALASTRPRAELMARTLTIWAYNEGAEKHYKDAGAKAKEWLTTDDDLLCEACRTMDGRVMDLGSNFENRGAMVAGVEIGLDVSHPPLHPHCRCSLVPVI